jgi:hypothetical protein
LFPSSVGNWLSEAILEEKGDMLLLHPEGETGNKRQAKE